MGYRLWDKEKSKLTLATELAAQAMKAIGPERQVILLCDRWYPKAEVAAFVEQFENLEMVCNASVDAVLYGPTPAKTGKKSRPRKRGERIVLDEILLSEPENGDWLIGMVPVITNLWKDKAVYALVTAPKTGKQAAVCSYARLIQELFALTGRIALTKQLVLMERKTSFTCLWPGMA